MTQENQQEDTPATGAIQTKEAEIIPADSALSIDPRDASVEAYRLLEQQVENQKKMIRLAISTTSPNQWCRFGDEGIYPTGGAGDTILRRVFGMTWRNKEVTVRGADDDMKATFTGDLHLRDNTFYETFIGERGMGGFIKNEADLRKGAFENAKSVAVRDILGLRFRTAAEMKELGLDVTKLERQIEFQDHTGNKDPGAARVKFGNDKDTLLSDIKDLSWYRKALEASVADPKKSQWKTKNKAELDIVDAELERRAGPPPGDDKSEKILTAIKKAKTDTDLEKVWKRVTKTDLTEGEKKKVKEAYGKRLAAIKYDKVGEPAADGEGGELFDKDGKGA